MFRQQGGGGVVCAYGTGSAYLQNGGSLKHLCHEGRYPFQLTVARTHSREDAVEDGNLSLSRRDERSYLGEQCDASDLSQEHARRNERI